MDVGDGEHLGQGPAAARPLDRGRRIVAAMAFGVEEAMELADRRQPARHRGGRESSCGQRAEIGAHVIAARRRDAAARRAQVRGIIREIARIGRQRVCGGAALGRQHVEIKLDETAVGRGA